MRPVERLWLLIALALPGLLALLVPMPAVDLAYQVRAGEMILSTGAVPASDSFTFTVAGAPWTDQQWLAQVVFALGFRVGGWELLSVLRAGLVVATSGLLLVVGLLRGASLRTSSVLALLAFLVAVPALALRPQLLAIPLFAGLLALAAARDRHPHAYLAAPLLVILWANIHGSFVLAPLLLGYAWLDDLLRGRPARHSAAVLVLGVLATCVTPFGPGVWAYAAGIGASPVISNQVSEWQRTSPLTVTGAVFYAAAAAAVIVAWRGRSRLSWADAAWLAGLTLIGVWAVRGVAWWPSGALLVVAAAMATRTEARGGARVTASTGLRAANSAVALVLGVGLIAALPWWRPSDQLTGRAGLLSYAPSGLALALRSHVEAGTRVFVPQTWASWFEWAVPDARYFLDSRFELYPPDVWADYGAISEGGAAAQDALQRWRIALLVWPSSWPAPAGAWTPVYADGDGALLVSDLVR